MEFKGLMSDAKKDAGVLGVQEFEASQGSGTPRLGGEFDAGDSSADEGDFDTKDQVSQQSGQYAPQQGGTQNPNIPPEEQPSLPPGEDYSEEGNLESSEPPLQPPTNQTGTNQQQQSSNQTPPQKNESPVAKPKHVAGGKTEPTAAPKGMLKPQAAGEIPQKPGESEELPHPLAATETPQPKKGEEIKGTTTNTQPQEKPLSVEKKNATVSSSSTQTEGKETDITHLPPLEDSPIQVINKESSDNPKEKKEGEHAVPNISGVDPTLVQTAPNPFGIEGPAPTAAPTASSFSQLSHETFALFNKMVGLITIQSTKEVSTTTVTVNMPGSVFDKAEIVLQQFPTAKNSFTVNIKVAPEAMGLLNKEYDNLVSSLQGAKLGSTIDLQRPQLLNEYQATHKKGPRPVVSADGKNKDKQDEDNQ
jgi:hypothetical protein